MVHIDIKRVKRVGWFKLLKIKTMKESTKGISKIFPQIMSRSMFCSRCAKNQMPSIGNIVIFFGEKRNKFFYEKIEQNNIIEEYGFTPHIILNPSIIILNDSQVVIFSAYCGMHGCGVKIDPHIGQFYYQEQRDITLSIENFISLMNTKDRSYYVNSKESYSFK